MAVPIIKAKVKKPRKRKRMSKGSDFPWQLHCIEAGRHVLENEFKTEGELDAYIERYSEGLHGPKKVQVVIPPMEY